MQYAPQVELLTERTERKFNDNILENNLVKISNYLDNFYVLSFHYFAFCLIKSMFDIYWKTGLFQFLQKCDI